MAEAESTILALQRFQTIVAMASELDLSTLHPPMAERTPLPLHHMLQWDDERLKRIARWRVSEDVGKDAVRAYAKVVLALKELEACSYKLPMHGQASPMLVPPAVISTRQPDPIPAATTVLMKSAVKPRRGGPEQTSTGRLCLWQPPTLKGGKFPLPSPPAILLDIARTWHTAFNVLLQTIFVLMQWAPVVTLFVLVCITVSEPLLLGRLLWRGVTMVPQGVRGLLEGSSVQPAVSVAQPAFFPHPQPAPVVQAVPTLIETCVDTVSWTEWLSVMLLAGEGGGAVVFFAHVRGFLG